MPRLREKSDSGKICRGSEHVPSPVNQRTPEVGIEKIFLRHLPRDDLASLWPGLAVSPFGHIGTLPGQHLLTGRPDPQGSHPRVFAILRLLRNPLGVQAMDDSVLHLVGVAENVARVEAQNAGKVVHSGHVAISRVRLHYVLPLTSRDFPLKYALKRRRPHLDRSLQSLAIDGIAGGESDCGSRQKLLRDTIYTQQLLP